MMKKGQNYNRPKEGSSIKVQPIRKKKDVDSIKKMLSEKPLDYCLFVLGINTNLRASDMLRIKVKDVRYLKAGDILELKEKKTGKKRMITLNKVAIKSIQNLISSKALQDSDYLFTGQRGVLTVPAVNLKVKTWCRAINLKGNYGSHTLRKTWGYFQRIKFGADIPQLMVCFNHSTQKQTLDYLCIQDKEIRDIYLNEI
jgi:integrase